jgi:FKBP-type peptidyl-prolyl cis-trans isomerase FklB
MKKGMLATVATVAIMLMAIGCYAADKKPEMKTLKEKVSYGIGLSIGKDFKRQDIDVDLDLLKRGIEDGLAGATPLLSSDQLKETMQAFQKEMRAKHQARNKALGEKNQKEGEAFLAANAKKEGVKTLPGGLQYKIIKKGTGKTPTVNDSVTVNYRGTLLDGTVFDSTYKRGAPATFQVNRVIPGWTEALQHMKEGAKWKLFIPPNLAYGARGAGSAIGPNAVLIFDVELIKVSSKAK